LRRKRRFVVSARQQRSGIVVESVSSKVDSKGTTIDGEGPWLLSVALPIHLGFRDAVGAMIRCVCSRLELAGKARSGTTDQVITAFNEAFNNLAIHGSPSDSDDARCQVEIELRGDVLILRLKDRSSGFDIATERPVPTEAEPGEGGYGLHIIRSFMSEVHYELGVDGEANVLTMVRSLDVDRA
jgi:anti-sigma regulatory factor (Ser/Thr protein kinase)